MIICKKALFDSYSKWLFDILEYVENRTDVSARSPYQQRAYGFLSERLMDVFLTANNINYKEYYKQNAKYLYKIWGFDYVSDAATVSVHINRLREKIEDDARNPKIIETVWGAGYRLSP